MSHEIDHGGVGGGILANKLLWLCVAAGVFVIIGFLIPVPQSMLTIVEQKGFARQMIEWHIASNAQEAARKTMMVVGLIPMAIILFATEAIPIGLTGILMPILAYFLQLYPSKLVGKTFAGDAPMFLLGVLAMGVVVIDVGLHKRLATWILGWTKGFSVPIIVLCISMSVIGSFISAHAMCAFMTPVMMAIYYGSIVAASPASGPIQHDKTLAKFLLFALCYALNVGGVGSPAAGGRNVIMMGIWDSYKVPMDFFTWLKYGLPLSPLLGFMVALYMLFIFGRKVKVRDLTPGLSAIKEETDRIGPMKYREWVTFGMLVLILALWIFGGHDLGLGGPSLLALIIPVVFRVTDWRKILTGISWDAWFMYCGALTLGDLLKDSGAALWIASSFLDILKNTFGFTQGIGLWISLSLLSGTITNFMSDAGTTALIGPIAVPMAIMSGHPWEPWASGLATAFATSFAHFLIVGTPNNAIVYGLGTFPDTGERAIAPIDFVKYGFVLWFLSLAIVWILEFMVIYNVVGFPPHILETARKALETAALK